MVKSVTKGNKAKNETVLNKLFLKIMIKSNLKHAFEFMKKSANVSITKDFGILWTACF